eukprot:gene14297-21927_t
MSRVEADATSLQDDMPSNVIAVEMSSRNIEVTLMEPCETFTLVLPENFALVYPEASVHLQRGGKQTKLGPGNLRTIIAQLNDVIRERPDIYRDMSSHYGTDEGEYDDDHYVDSEQEAVDKDFLDDFERLRQWRGDVVTYQDNPLLDSLSCTIRLSYDDLPNRACQAWGLAPKSENKPLLICLVFSRTAYLSARFTAKCTHDVDSWCGVAGQLTTILKAFSEKIWSRSRAVDAFVSKGWTRHLAEEMLQGCDWSVDEAAQRLEKGQPVPQPVQPASKSPYATATEKSRIPLNSHGFLAQVLEYAELRMRTCNEFCVLCDQPHAAGVMVKATVCTRNICAFAFQQLGVGTDAASGMITAPAVAELLLCMAISAAKDSRWELIFNPYPLVFDPSDPTRKLFDPDKKSQNDVTVCLDSMVFEDVMNGVGGPQATRSLLFQWILRSNTSYLVHLAEKETIPSICTPHQYLLLSTSPSRQEVFDRLKAAHGTTFAWHGSSMCNWHSILRNGLFNASGTSFEVHGAAFGAGVIEATSLA